LFDGEGFNITERVNWVIGSKVKPKGAADKTKRLGFLRRYALSICLFPEESREMIVKRLFCFFCQSVDFSGSESEGHGASLFLVTRNEIKKPV
jgi:hypothetical protein